jgi:hypothetical protein
MKPTALALLASVLMLSFGAALIGLIVRSAQKAKNRRG